MPANDLFALLDPPERGRVVDFGAGTGYLTFKLARARHDLRVYAMDEQATMLDRLRERVTTERATNVEVIDPAAFAELENLDAILAVNVLHEMSDRALESIAAALDDRGTALFVDWNAAVERPVGPPAAHVYTLDQAKQRLASAGFVVGLERVLLYHYIVRVRLYR